MELNMNFALEDRNCKTVVATKQIVGDVILDTPESMTYLS